MVLLRTTDWLITNVSIPHSSFDSPKLFETSVLQRALPTTSSTQFFPVAASMVGKKVELFSVLSSGGTWLTYRGARETQAEGSPARGESENAGYNCDRSAEGGRCK